MSPASSAEARQPTALLQAPESVSDVGVRKAFLEDLALKTIYVTAPGSVLELSTTMRLSYRVTDELFRRLRSEQLVEVTGMEGNSRQIALTSRGRSRALELIALNRYVGPAPVSIESYVQQVKRQSVRDLEVHEPEVNRAFAPLVLDEPTLTKLGNALQSGSSIFLYGPTGSGKTAIATLIPRVMDSDRVWVPYAVQADGEVITVFDAQVHTKVDEPVAEDNDPRWVLCKRPTMLVGGELTAEMLELQLNPTSKYYSAPVQMKANNGVLIVDDFGRQRMRPEEMLNRWVVPLDRRIDFLTLAGGKKIEIPFEMFVVFATNLDPSTLAEDAFLRRIHSKIRVGNVGETRFRAIFSRVSDQWGITSTPGIVDTLIDAIRNRYHEPLRACHPRDIINHVRWAARYKKVQPELTNETLLAAVDSYFLPDGDINETTE
jgi:predicted ATPase with chaperone activity